MQEKYRNEENKRKEYYTLHNLLDQISIVKD